VTRGSPAREVQKEQTRARLVEAALSVFARRGYQEATVDEVAATAGYSKGAFYFHFNSKEEVFLELLKLWAAEQTDRLKAFEAPVPAAALLEGLEAFLSYERRARNWPPLVLEFWSQGRREPPVQDALRRAYGSWQKRLIQAFRQAASGPSGGGLLAGVAPEVAARTVLATHDGLLVETCMDPDSVAQGSLRRVLGTLLRYLASGAPEVILDATRTPASPPSPRRRRQRPSAA